MRRLLYAAMVTLGVGHLLRRTRAGGVVLCYHNVIAEDDVPPGDRALHLPVSAFTEQVEFLRRAFTIIPLSEVAARQQQGKSLRGTAALSFDDGYRGVLQHALPVLSARGIPATLFVTSVGAASGKSFWWDWPVPGPAALEPAMRRRLLEECQGDAQRIATALQTGPVPTPDVFRPASWAELKAARGSLLAVEGHSASHRALTALNAEEVEAELRQNADDIEREMGKRPTLVAYPYGLWNPAVSAAAARAGYAAGFTLDSHDVTSRSPVLGLPRINIPSSVPQPAFELWVSGLAAARAPKPA